MYCTLLREACEGVRSGTFEVLGEKPTSSQPRFIDLESCVRFQILGQAGAISGWHMDNAAPYTWVTLEGNETEHTQPELVLKYWAVIATDLMTSDEIEHAREDFKKYGEKWLPKKEWIRTISLTCGDTLIMPPGTIHAPITVTDCLFRGGMCWDKRSFACQTLPY